MTHNWLRGGLAAVLVIACGTVSGSTPTEEQGDWKPDPGYISLFNGKDFTGWKYYKEKDLAGKTETSDKRFEVKDGVIVVNEKDEKGKGGIKDLYTIQEFNKDFNLKLEFRAAPRADSGVYLRATPNQLQVCDYPTVGPYKKVMFNSGDWNTLDITVKGGGYKTTLNNKTVGPQDAL